MFCPKCGAALADGSRFCKVCGTAVSTPGTPPVVLSPIGPAQTSGKAKASMIFGFFFFVLPSAIVAIVLGHISLSEIRKSTGRLKGEGMAIAGLVLGYMGLAALPFILIIAAIAIPNLLRARIAANEASAVGSVRLLDTAEISYSMARPEEGFSCDLPKIVSHGDLNPTLGTGTRNGYVFALQNCEAENPGGPNKKFQVVAYPANRNQTGIRAFCSDESGIIKFDAGGSAQNCLETGSALQ